MAIFPPLWLGIMILLGAFFGWLIFGDPVIGTVAGTLVGTALFIKAREEGRTKP